MQDGFKCSIIQISVKYKLKFGLCCFYFVISQEKVNKGAFDIMPYIALLTLDIICGNYIDVLKANNCIASFLFLEAQ